MIGFLGGWLTRAWEAIAGRRGDPYEYDTSTGGWRYRYDDGEKWPGGFGPTQLLVADYWTLRARSVQLFEQNHYARGVIRRLLTNVINVGLHLESTPEESILGYPDDGLAKWTEEVETRFELWGNEPLVCDHYERSTFGALQAQAFTEALIAGDVLVLLQQDPRTKLPRVRLVSGSAVQTPLGVGALGQLPNGNRVVHGVELDAAGRHVAFHVQQADGTSKRLPAYGEKSGRKLAWLVYATEKKLDDVRGKPLLSLIAQSLLEIDRYRDALQRKAVLNAVLAMYIKRDVPGPAGRGMSGIGKRGKKETVDTDGKPRHFNTQEHIPGVIIDVLGVGEEPKSFNTQGTTEEFGKFEEALIQSVAWALEIPPEILTLSFSSNYSASQAAIYEFKLTLNKALVQWGWGFCQPIYADWLLSAVLSGKVKARGFLEAWRDFYAQSDVYTAWVMADWAGQIKPAVDPVKVMKAAESALKLGLTTRARLCREYFGQKWSKVIRILTRENEQMAVANKPLAELEASTKPAPQLPPKGNAEPDQDDDEEADDKPAKGEDAKGLVN